MILLALCIGLGLPALLGWLVVDLAEWRMKLLMKSEKIALGFVVGSLLWSLLIFVWHTVSGWPLSAGWLTTMLGIVCAILAGIALLQRKKHVCIDATDIVPSLPLSTPWRLALGALLLWTTCKILLSGIVFLLLTPTYLDDTLDNWNLRAKVFFVDKHMTLALPGEDPVASALGISSYPPGVALFKTWLALLHGSWSEPLINLPHLLWYLCGIVLLYAAARRRMEKRYALLCTYAFCSLPLTLMHGTNPYGDMLVSVCVLGAAVLIWRASLAMQQESKAALLRIAGVVLGLLTFTKNEGLLLYMPPLVLVAVAVLLWKNKNGLMKARDAVMHGAMLLAPLLLLALPWLSYKWLNGLTFGNAKPVTSLGIGWQSGVVDAVWINTFFEGNWLLLFPLFSAALILRMRRAATSLLPLTAFVLCTYVGQLSLFLFTGLSVEAIRQTGYARGLVHLAPTIVLLCALLLVPYLQTAKENDHVG